MVYGKQLKFDINRQRGFRGVRKMKSKQELGLAVLLTIGLVFMIIINAKLPSEDENRELAKAVFYVA